MEEQYTDKINAYFKRTLNAEERSRFEEEIRSNPELQQLVAEYRLNMDVVDLEEADELRSKFVGWKENRQEQHRQRRLYAIISISAAASVAILAGLYFLIHPVPESNKAIAFQAYTLPETPGDILGTMDEKWSAGVADYRSGSFEKAIKEWEAIKEKTPEVEYYLAHCYFNMKEFNGAISIFSKLSAGTSVYSYLSDWYLALAYLASDHTGESIKELDTILENRDHPFYFEAQKLKAKITNKGGA
jgi:tetratricopeptide (TPR) repeat protein